MRSDCFDIQEVQLQGYPLRLGQAEQQRKLNELAIQYNVDLKRIMGVNVAFDLLDNTDDAEPAQVHNRDAMLVDSGASVYSRDALKDGKYKAANDYTQKYPKRSSVQKLQLSEGSSKKKEPLKWTMDQRVRQEQPPVLRG